MNRSNSTSIPGNPRVCLVTEELAGHGGSGGIGAAFRELAVMLAARGAAVDVLYCPVAPLAAEEAAGLQDAYLVKGIKLLVLDESRWVEGATSYEKRAYAVFRELEMLPRYDVVHFHDYKGLGFFAINARRQGLAFRATRMVVQLHGPTRWTIEANGAFFVHEDQLKIDHMERGAIAGADDVVSPSAYLVDWLRTNGYALPSPDRVHVIKNVCTGLLEEIRRYRRDDSSPEGGTTDLVLFARHEDRKGFAVFCDALDRLDDFLTRRGVTVSFVGKLGAVNCQPSGIYLADRSRGWSFRYRVRTGLDRSGAARYITSCARPLVVVPSPHENSPYTVLETVALGVPLIASLDGGGAELVEPGYAGLTMIEPEALAATIRRALEQGLPPATPAESLEAIEAAWWAFHEQPTAQPPAVSMRRPRVAFAITHHERPTKLVDAVLSAARQTYVDIDLIVVDDGSTSPAAVAALEQLEVLITRLGGRLIRRENGYLGAARNTALAATDAEYICFLDDDDYAFPTLVETLVRAAESTGADVVNCLNVYMPEVSRAQTIARAGEDVFQVGYVPIGGPLSVAVTENCLGAATALIRTEALRAVGGYTELKGVGHEDYELFLRLLQAGRRIEIAPRPLYFYEIGRPSMLSRTSLAANFRRCYDAVDVADAGAMRDLVSLTLGKKVAIDGHNRQWWLYSQTPTAAIRHRIMADVRGRDETLRALLELCQADGNVAMALAIADDLRSSAPDTDDEADLVRFEAVHAPAVLPPYDAHLGGIKIDLALGHHDAALEALVRHLRSVTRVDASQLGLVRQVFIAARHPAGACRELADALAAQRVPRALLDEHIVLLAAVERRASPGVRSAALDSVVARDEAAYVARHADVREAVDDGRFRRAAEHFLKFGATEGRAGFERVQDVVTLAACAGDDGDVESLLEAACGDPM